MYDFLDRPVVELDRQDRFLLAAMRAWVHALTLSGVPSEAVASRFADDGEGFDDVMRILDRASSETLEFQRPCHAVVEETEAVMLGIWRLVAQDRLQRATAAASGLVDPDCAAALIRAMQPITRDLPA